MDLNRSNRTFSLKDRTISVKHNFYYLDVVLKKMGAFTRKNLVHLSFE